MTIRVFQEDGHRAAFLRGNHVPGEHLLAFGDGYVEIRTPRRLAAWRVAVASDEANNGSGNFDAWKRKRLFGGGGRCCHPGFPGGAIPLLRCIGRAPRPGNGFLT